MHRFYLPPNECACGEPLLRGREAHHARDVLRLTHGQRVQALDGAGHILECELARIGREEARLRVLERHEVPPPPFRVSLLQAIPKGRMMEDIIEKAVELGAHRVTPLLAERVVVRLSADEADTRAARWRQTAIEAIKQSGNPWLPEVETPLTPAAFLARREEFDLMLIGSLLDPPCHLRDRIQAFKQQRGRLPITVAVWIGPEGDFTPGEVELAKAAGAQPISLGRLVLRCETAALYCLSVLNHELTSTAG